MNGAAAWLALLLLLLPGCEQIAPADPPPKKPVIVATPAPVAVVKPVVKPPVPVPVPVAKPDPPHDPNLGWSLLTKSYGGDPKLIPNLTRKACETARDAAIPKMDYFDTTKIEPTPAPGNIVSAECLPP